MDLGFFDDIIDAISGIFKKDEAPVPPPVKPIAPTAPYDNKTNKPPDLFEIPKDLALYAVNWLVRSGLSLEGAAAVTGNLWRESYLNPTQKQITDSGLAKGPGRGLAQWTDSTLTRDRSDDNKGRWDTYRKEFFPSLKKSHEYWKPYDIDSIEPQLAFIVHELRNEFPGVFKELSAPGSVRSKAITVLKKYEIARDRDKPEEQNLRVNLSEKIYSLAKQDKNVMAIIDKRQKDAAAKVKKTDIAMAKTKKK